MLIVTMIVFKNNLIMMKHSKVNKFLEPLQASTNHVIVVEPMDIGFHLADFVVNKAIVSTKCDDDQHCMRKFTTSHLVTVILNLYGVQIKRISYNMLYSDVIIRVPGLIIPITERVIYALHPSTRISLVEPVCVVKIQHLRKILFVEKVVFRIRCLGIFLRKCRDLVG